MKAAVKMIGLMRKSMAPIQEEAEPEPLSPKDLKKKSPAEHGAESRNAPYIAAQYARSSTSS